MLNSQDRKAMAKVKNVFIPDNTHWGTAISNIIFLDLGSLDQN